MFIMPLKLHPYITYDPAKNVPACSLIAFSNNIIVFGKITKAIENQAIRKDTLNKLHYCIK